MNPRYAATAVLLEIVFDESVQTSKLASAAGENDVLEHPSLEFRVEGADQFSKSLHDTVVGSLPLSPPPSAGA